MFVCWLSRLFIHFFNFFFFFPSRDMTGCFFSSSGREGKHFEDPTGCDLLWFCPCSRDHPHPEAQWGLLPWSRLGWSFTKPGWFLRALNGWGVSSSLYTSVSQIQAFLQRFQAWNFHEVMKGSGNECWIDFFFSFLNSTPNFCARASQTLLLLVPTVRETALLRGCLSEETTPAVPCLMGSECYEGERAGLERSNYGKNDLLSTPLQGQKEMPKGTSQQICPCDLFFLGDAHSPSLFLARVQRDAAGSRGSQHTHTLVLLHFY